VRDLIRQKIIDGLSAQVPYFTRREVFLPRPGGKKAYAVTGTPCGEDNFMWQELDREL